LALVAVNVAFDLRDPQRSGIARAATSIARTFLRLHASEFTVSLAGPMDALRAIGAPEWGAARIVDWSEPRYTMLGLGWHRASGEIGPALWYFPHWDVPLLAMRSTFVATINDLAHLRLPEHSGLKRLVARQWIQQTVRSAGGLTAISEYTAQQVRSMWPSVQHKLSVAPLAVGELFFQPAPPLPASITQLLRGSRYMLSVGIRKERKNLRVGVSLLERIPELKWVVMGESFPEWQQVEDIAREARVFDRMIVLDRHDETTLRSLYGSAEFLLFPSRYEGFGLPVLEALASGTPVIASRATSIPEVLGDAGWLCDPDDTECFARSAIELLALGSRRASVIERGRARAREFTWERTADGLAQALRASAPRTGRRKSP
jgi:glycosyltransferase involved in cell wall biosynthesis